MRLILDLETSSTADLRLTGAAAYAEHPDTRVTVLCYAVDDEPVDTWLAGPASDRFIAAVRADAIIVAHNYLFEFNVYHQKLVPQGWPRLPLERWSCTMARCYVAGYPGGLELASKAAKLAIPKDAGARDLMLRMARPRTVTPTVTWWHETSPEHFKRLQDYCATDVEAERLLDRTVPELSPRERAIFEVDHAINQRGLRVDERLVHRLHDLAAEARHRITRDLIRATNAQVTTPNQVARLKTWLAGVGVDLPDLRRATVQARLLDPALAGAPRTVLQGRLDASRASTAKLDAILAARSLNGRVLGTFQYYGANRSGRWAGRRLQPQNLFKGSIADIPTALLTVMHPDTTAADLEALYEDSAMGVVASCLRSTIEAPQDHRLVILDLSQIEARVLAWVADERASLACFARGDDIYTDTALRVGSASRQLGKVLVLACGFGMGATRFQLAALAFGVVLDLMTCESMVAAWRTANPAIVQFWWNAHRALLRITRAGAGSVLPFGKLVFKRHHDAVLIQLPSERHLVYRGAHVGNANDYGNSEFCYMGSPGGGWVHQRSWPGKITENIVQAIARDVLAEAMILLHRRGVPLIATMHDELIAEVPEAEADHTYDLMQRIMRTSPGWAPDLPLDAAGFVARRYHKK
jgi:DNA polymerase